MYTIRPCTCLQCHLIQSHICRVHVYLAVTCHLRFWQNDNDQNLFHAAVVTQGWNGYRNKSQHRKLTQQKKIRPPLLPGLEPKTFRSGIWRSTNELSLLPDFKYVCTNLILFVTCDGKLVNLLSADLVTNP